MTLHSRSPAFIIIDSHSPYAPHKSQMCLRDFFPPSAGHNLGTSTATDTTSADNETMVNDLVDALKVFYLATTVFDLATVYTQALPTGPAFPIAAVALTQVGTSVSAGQAKAVQASFQFRTTTFHIAKLVLLDVPVGGGGFEKIPFGSWDANSLSLLNQLVDPATSWVGQDGDPFNQGVSITYTMNEKLRKAYRMT